MKQKILKNIIHSLWIMLAVLISTSCSKETTIRDINTDDDYFFLWSSTTKGDTLVYDCVQNVRLNLGDEETVLNPVASVKLYLKDKTILVNEENLKPILEAQDSSDSSYGRNPITYILNKEFSFNDKQEAHINALYERYVSGDESKFIPFVSIQGISFKKAEITKKSTNTYLADLYFEIKYKDEYTQKPHSFDAKLSYTQEITEELIPEPEDTIVNVTYEKGIEWQDHHNFVLYVDKIKTYSISGETKTRYTSPTLTFDLNAKQDKTLSVENFDFKSRVVSNNTSYDLSKDNWKIVENEHIHTVKYSNNIDQFDDIFTYSTYEVSFVMDEDVINFDLDFNFNTDNVITDISDVKKTNQTEGALTFSSKVLKEKVTSTLELKGYNPPPSPEDNAPKHGKILAHYVSAVFSPTGDVTKKCVIIRYEKGYDWGLCEYNEDFPKSFTYTQSGYSGFNSLGYDKNTKKFRLAHATDESKAIYWRREDNSVLAAIDYITCKTIGWKNIVNGKYSYKMSSYKEEYENSNYKLTITSPSGEKRTFYSQKAD